MKHAYIFSIRTTNYNGPDKELVQELYNRFKTLPFASRWITWLKKRVVESKLNFLSKSGVLHRYPVLIDVDNGIVSQAENTYIVTRDGFIKVTNEDYVVLR